MSINSKLNALSHVIKGYYKKLLIDIGFWKVRNILRPSSKPSTVVSVTSYGRRVRSVLYYTLISILRQTLTPDKIIVWLQEDQWTYDSLPKRLKDLSKFGIEFKFCSDLRSYKKLLPSLQLYPNSLIVTFDDDVIYEKEILADLISEHRRNPSAIVCGHARYPQQMQERFTEYNSWPGPPIVYEKAKFIMPVGAGGVLYPPNSLHEEVLNYDIAQKLCPIADDLWFWIMAKRNNTSHIVIRQDKSIGDGFDDLYQVMHKGSALTHSNSKKNLNDIQLDNLMTFFGLTPKELIQL